MRHKQWTISIIALISPFVILSGCVEFKSIEQPSSVLTDEVFTVFIEATTEDNSENGEPYFGIRLPKGWTIPGDAIPYTGVDIDNVTIIYDRDLALEQESLSPSPQGYYWWVGAGDRVVSEDGPFYAEVQIQTDNQTGRFSLDYMLGYDSVRHLNEERSDDHLIEVVDEYTPRELRAVVEGDAVSLNWGAPLVSEGLIGYDVYRDGEIITTNPVLDTVYVDENPAQELASYTVSSLYDSGDVHLPPYEIKVLVLSGGTGAPHDPFQISTAIQLASLSAADFPHLDKCFILVNDIDLDPNLPGGQVFERAVIAPDISELEDDFQGSGFTGTLDGNGHTISHLTISGDSHLGLFGKLGPGAIVTNLVLEAVRVKGTDDCIGALVGSNQGGSITASCYSTGLVEGFGVGEGVGGLVGLNAGSIASCYSTGSVNGNSTVGGLVGGNGGSITVSYSTGSVNGIAAACG